MNVSDAIRTNRAVRKFADRPLDEDAVRAILNAGRRAQSSRNTQPRQFIAIRDPEKLRWLSTMGPYSGHLAGAALGVVILTPDPTDDLSVLLDAGQSIALMMLAAWELGIGSAITTLQEVEQVQKELGVPAEYQVRYALSFGYPADPEMLQQPPKGGGRKPLEEVVHWEQW